MSFAILARIQPDHSLNAFTCGPLIIRETVYGIRKRLDFVIQHIESYRQRRGLGVQEVNILDVGCGTGVNITIPLAQAGYSVVGLDLHSPSVERGRELSRDLNNIRFVCGALESGSVQQNFHIVICSEVLEHLREPEVLLKRMGSVLETNGLLLLTIPNGFGFFEMDSFIWRLLCRSRALVRILYGWENKFWRLLGPARILKRRAEEHKPNRLESTWSTLAPDMDHHQSFTNARVTSLLTRQGFRILEFRNNTFVAGNLLGLIVRELDLFLSWNCRVADKLPRCLVSGWLIAAEKSYQAANE